MLLSQPSSATMGPIVSILNINYEMDATEEKRIILIFKENLQTNS